MMQGEVNERLEAIVSLALIDPNGATVTLAALIDSGFTGELLIPSSVAASLHWEQTGAVESQLADGSIVDLPFVTARIAWCDSIIDVEAIIVESETLIGMQLLNGSRLTIDVAVAGRVAIEPLR